MLSKLGCGRQIRFRVILLAKLRKAVNGSFNPFRNFDKWRWRSGPYDAIFRQLGET